MHAEMIITVRYTGSTWQARVKGYKKTASCVYDAGLAAKALAQKLGLDADGLVKAVDGHDYQEFVARPLRCLPAHWRMAPELPTIAMTEAGRRALEAGGSADQVFAAMLEQAPSPEAQPAYGRQTVRQEVQ